MKKMLLLTLAGTLVSMTASAKDLRIGVVNMQRAVSETKEGLAAERRLTGMKKKLEDELNRKLKEFYDKQGQLMKAASILKDDEKRKREAQSRKEFEALQKRYLEAERSLMQRKAKEMMTITKKLSKVIEHLAKRDKYDYIFANAAVLWAPRHVDLTNEVIREFDGK